jgi:antitoxin VbhA-like protein
MDELTIKARPHISAEESRRRKEAVRKADAHNRIEGLARTPETDAIFDAYVRGEIEPSELVPRIKAQLGLR